MYHSGEGDFILFDKIPVSGHFVFYILVNIKFNVYCQIHLACRCMYFPVEKTFRYLRIINKTQYFAILSACIYKFSRTLGYSDGRAVAGSAFGNITSSIRVLKIDCSGNEKDLSKCQIDYVTPGICTKYLSVYCSHKAIIQQSELMMTPKRNSLTFFVISFTHKTLLVIRSVSDVPRAQSRFVKFVGVEAARQTPLVHILQTCFGSEVCQ